MDGFDLEKSYGDKVPPNPQYAFVERDEIQPIWDLASQYVLADAMFTSQIDSSFASHQYIIAGQAGDAANIPRLKWGCGGGRNDVIDTLQSDRTIGPQVPPCFDYPTIADELETKGLTWRSYAAGQKNANSGYDGYEAIHHIVRSPDWGRHVHSPPASFLKDIANGKLASVTWITPTGHASDHPAPQGGGKQGPQWVANVVNAVGESRFWDTSAVFVMWDEWGGWYDHVPPRYVDFDGLGFRVPLIVISPYAKRGYVSHVQYEHGSILKFVEDTFGLGRLAASDTRATSPAADCFDFTQNARPFVPIKTKLRARDFIDAPPDLSIIDAEEAFPPHEF